MSAPGRSNPSVAEAGAHGPGRVPRRSLRAFRNPNYRLYFFGQLVSQTGSWLQRIAQSWLVLQLTDSPTALGILNAAQVLAIMVRALCAGVIADRLPRRRLLYAITIIETIQSIALAVLTLTNTI